MSVRNFVPEIWHAELETRYFDSLVLSTDVVVNRDYEGNLANFGDTVHITKMGRGRIDDYQVTTTTRADGSVDVTGGGFQLQAVNTTQQTLTADQDKAFAILIDNVDVRQAAGDFEATALAEYARGLAEHMERFIATKMKTEGVQVSHAGETDIAVYEADPHSLYRRVILPARTYLSRAGVPDDGRRFLLLSPELYAIALDDSRWTPPTSAQLELGIAGRMAGFNVIETNYVDPATPDAEGNFILDDPDTLHAIAGHPSATTVAESFLELRANPSLAYSGDQLDGRHVYGAKVTRPEALAYATVTLTSGENPTGSDDDDA